MAWLGAWLLGVISASFQTLLTLMGSIPYRSRLLLPLFFFMLYSICGDYFNLAGIDIGDWAVFVPSGTLSGVTILCEYPVCTSLSFVFLASHSLITFISFTGTSLFPSFHYSIPPSEAVQYYGYLSA